MKNYIVYIYSGEIIKTGQCQDCDLYLQGENVIEGIADDSKQYIKNGQIVDMPDRPSNYHLWSWETMSWQFNDEIASSNLKETRKELLTESDWTQLPDVPLATKQAWATYRQALRDITTQEGYPFSVIWPTKPE